MDTKNETRARTRRRGDCKDVFKKIRSYKEGKCMGKSTQLDNLPEIRDEWDRMYEWLLVLMVSCSI